MLERFRGRCLINIDRSRFYWKEIITLLNSKGMQDQILLKSGVTEELLKEVETIGDGIMYMPIMKTMEEWELVKAHNIKRGCGRAYFHRSGQFLCPAGIYERASQ